MTEPECPVRLSGGAGPSWADEKALALTRNAVRYKVGGSGDEAIHLRQDYGLGKQAPRGNE